LVVYRHPRRRGAHRLGRSDHDNIISVLATDHLDQLAWFGDLGSNHGSNFGARTVDVGAPGVNCSARSPATATGCSAARPWQRRT